MLPFEGADAESDDDYLADGITESILNKLTRVSELRVVPRSTVFRYKGRDDLPGVIGRELRVRALVTGRVVQRGTHRVVSAELTDVATESQLWGDRLTPNSYTLAPSVVRTGSRGRIRLASPDPAVHPRIDINFLESRADVDALIAATELCREVGAAKAFDGLRKRELMPGKLGRAAMEDFVRKGATTYFHPVGSCKMGPDALAVVDGALRVHGTQGRRVADASIMPTITTGNTNAPSIMISERAADLIRARA